MATGNPARPFLIVLSASLVLFFVFNRLTNERPEAVDGIRVMSVGSDGELVPVDVDAVKARLPGEPGAGTRIVATPSVEGKGYQAIIYVDGPDAPCSSARRKIIDGENEDGSVRWGCVVACDPRGSACPLGTECIGLAPADLETRDPILFCKMRGK